MSLASFSAAASAAISMSSIARVVAVTWLARPPWSAMLTHYFRMRTQATWRLAADGGPEVLVLLFDQEFLTGRGRVWPPSRPGRVWPARGSYRPCQAGLAAYTSR